MAAFANSPSERCQTSDVRQSIVTILNNKVGTSEGPPARVTSAAELKTIAGSDGMFSCHGVLKTVDGPNGPGTVQVVADVKTNGDGRMTGYAVRDAKWETDADRDHREAARKEEAAKREAAAAQAAKELEEMRTASLVQPNKTVHCSIGHSLFWTTSAFCYAMIEEMHDLSGSLKSEPHVDLIERCARDIEKKVPGNRQPIYVNECQKLVETYAN